MMPLPPWVSLIPGPWPATSVLYLASDSDSLVIRDAVTSENSYRGVPYSRFSGGNDVKYRFDSSGMLKKQPHVFGARPKLSVIDLPDASGGHVGEGFTITGLAYGGGSLWCGNDGGGIAGDPPGNSSVVQLTTTGVKVSEILMQSVYSNGTSVQGVAYDTTDGTLWVAQVSAGKVRHLTTTGFDIGDGFDLAGINGLTYDSTRDRLWCLVGQILTRRQSDGTSEFSLDLGLSVWDQLHYDADRDGVWITNGANGSAGTLHLFDIASETITRVATVADATSIEGMAIVDGAFYVAHDGYYHQSSAVIDKNQIQVYEGVKGSAHIAWSIDHDPLDNNSILGYLVEPAFTRLNNSPTEFGVAQWIKTGVSAEADAVTSPTGSQDAETLTAAVGTSVGRYIQNDESVTTTNYAWSVIAKAGTHNYLWIGDRGDAVIHSASFNLSTGAVIGQSNGTGAIRDLGGGWYMCELRYTRTNAGTAGLRIAFGAAAHSTDYPTGTWIGTETLHLFYSGIGAAAFATSPIFDSMATNEVRDADVPILSTSEFDFSPTDNTFVVQGRTARASGTQVLFQIDDGTANERMRMERNSSNELHFIVTDGGVTQCDVDLGTVANNTAFKVAVRCKAGDFGASLNGEAVVTDSSGTLPTVTVFRLGHSTSGEQWSSTIYSLSVIPRGSSDGKLVALSAI